MDFGRILRLPPPAPPRAARPVSSRPRGWDSWSPVRAGCGIVRANSAGWMRHADR